MKKYFLTCLLALLATAAPASSQIMRLKVRRFVGQTISCNAVRISKDTAISVNHCVLQTLQSKNLKEIVLDELPTKIVKLGENLVLYKFSGASIVRIAPIGSDLPKEPILVHLFWDMQEQKNKIRLVARISDCAIIDGFRHGMSGSGVYTLQGKLIGLAELTSGFYWNIEHIREFLSK